MAAIPFPKKKSPRRVVIEELKILAETYPAAETALTFRNSFELLIAVILSAQCTDARVNATTPGLFERYPTPQALAAADPQDVETRIKSCGFFRMKTRNIISCSRDLVERFGGDVPSEREPLESLAGVGRKTASVVLANAFSKAALAVDTHVFRVAHRIGATVGKTPLDVERDLTSVLPERQWGDATHWLILHGRAVCKAPTPRCGVCPLERLCPTPPILARVNAGRRRRSAAAAKKRSAVHRIPLRSKFSKD